MTNEQKNQVAAMNVSGMSIDEIVMDTGLSRREVEDFVSERNTKRKQGQRLPESTKQAIREWYQSGHSVSATAKKFGVDPKTVKSALQTDNKEKEPIPAATETSSKVSVKADINSLAHTNDNIKTTESQALKGVEVIGLMQTMLIGIEENFGDNVDIMSLRADSEQAHLMFRYGGTDYVLSFGLAF